MAGKPIVLHLEDVIDWINEVKQTLGDDFEVYSARTLREAVAVFRKSEIDVAVIDISLLENDRNNLEGEEFMDNLEAAGVLPGNRIIVLSALLDEMVYKDRIRRYFRDFAVWDVMRKQTFDPVEFKKSVTEASKTPFVPDA